VQLDNQTELMLFRLRKKDGSIDAYSAGTYVDTQGHARHLARDEFSLTPLGYWKSGSTGANYPVRWQIRVPSLGLSLDAAAAVDAQELATGDQTGPAYWEGSVTYTGSATGAGYLEMTGYDKPVRLE
jgi:predicted secreted hydrolase